MTETSIRCRVLSAAALCGLGAPLRISGPANKLLMRSRTWRRKPLVGREARIGTRGDEVHSCSPSQALGHRRAELDASGSAAHHHHFAAHTLGQQVNTALYLHPSSHLCSPLTLPLEQSPVWQSIGLHLQGVVDGVEDVGVLLDPWHPQRGGFRAQRQDQPVVLQLRSSIQ